MPAPVRFTPIPRERVPFVWEHVWPELKRALPHDPTKASETDIYASLTSGRSQLSEIDTGGGRGLLMTTLATVGEHLVCQVNYFTGTIDGQPRAFVREVRRFFADLERQAANAGCSELWLGGRDWSRALPDWEHFDPEHPNRIRKRLAQ